MSFESNARSGSSGSSRRHAAEANLRIALFLRQVRWINLVLVAAVLFAGIVSIGVLALTQPPRGSARDVIPFVLVAGVGQLGAFYAIFHGLRTMRLFTGPRAPVEVEQPREQWRIQLRRTRVPMVVLGLTAAVIGIIFTEAAVITITGAGLGLAFILQLVVLLSVATRSRAAS